MIYRATTETGSIYVIDTEEKTWHKERQPNYTGLLPLRTKSGVFKTIGAIRVGMPITMTGKPIDPEATFRLITTSFVVELEECDTLPE